MGDRDGDLTHVGLSASGQKGRGLFMLKQCRGKYENVGHSDVPVTIFSANKPVISMFDHLMINPF